MMCYDCKSPQDRDSLGFERNINERKSTENTDKKISNDSSGGPKIQTKARFLRLLSPTTQTNRKDSQTQREICPSLHPKFPSIKSPSSPLVVIDTIFSDQFKELKVLLNSFSNLIFVSKKINKIAYKKYRGNYLMELRSITDKTRMQQELRHENILQIYKFQETQNSILIEMEYGGNQNLQQFICSSGSRLSENEIFLIFRQLCLIVEFLHSKQIVLSCLAPQNFLISPSLKVKMYNLNFCTRVGKLEESQTSLRGFPNFLPPEMEQGKSYNYLADIRGLGACLKEMCYGVPEKGDKIQTPELFEFAIEDDVKDLIRQMLHTDPTQRCTLSQIFASDWFKRMNREALKLQPARAPSPIFANSKMSSLRGSLILPENFEERGIQEKDIDDILLASLLEISGIQKNAKNQDDNSVDLGKSEICETPARVTTRNLPLEDKIKSHILTAKFIKPAQTTRLSKKKEINLISTSRVPQKQGKRLPRKAKLMAYTPKEGKTSSNSFWNLLFSFGVHGNQL